ncbi:MAG: hypothetical protein ACFFFH_17960 [Candidatus Thorarchaeota archaeon]
MYEILKAIPDFRMQIQDKNELLKHIITWQEKYETSIRGKETYGTTIKEPSFWNSGLSSDKIYSSLSHYIKRALNRDISAALERVRDILHEKHGHALYLAEIAREASR